MAEYRTVDVVATVTRQTFEADGTVTTNTFDVTADGGKIVVIDPYISIEQTDEGAVVTVTDKQGVTTATIYNGKDGQDGQDGRDGRDGQSGVDGFSPTATVSKSGNVATISITDKSGTTSAQVVDGAKGDKGDKGDPGIGIKGDKGDPGADGQDGADGFSPVASVSKSGNTTTISITDKNGTTTATVNDGVGDVASVNGKTGAVVLDADDVGALPDDTVIPTVPTNVSAFTNDAGYLTSYTETDPTVPAWAKAQSKPTYTAAEVGALPDTVTIPTATSDLTNDIGYVDASGAASAAPVQSVNGQTGTVVLDAADVGALPDTTVIPTKTSDLTNDSDFMSGMTILAYGKSTWADFLAAYTAKHVVYCRASSASNPASGSQTRMAFMAYVNNETNPTNVEFQYYRSVSSHSATQQGDQVYVYKLDKTAGWTVTVRECYTRIVAGTGLKTSYSNGVLTVSLDS